MKSIYLVFLPRGYSPNVFAFSTEEKAKNICNAFNEEYPTSGSGRPPLSYTEIPLDNYELKYEPRMDD